MVQPPPPPARPARAAPEPPSPRPGHLGNPGRPAPGHKPRDCPRPRGLRSSGPGQPGAERAACSRRPRAGVGASPDFPSWDLREGGRGFGQYETDLPSPRLGACRAADPLLGGTPSSTPPQSHWALSVGLSPVITRGHSLRVKNLESRVKIVCPVGKSQPSQYPEFLICNMGLIPNPHQCRRGDRMS